ncbi:alpha/beta hydrolase family protein [Catenuloplanes atrovinosus]|uniref:Dienelactone hydrolase n=1 Tax=Catenuloplanes atrovinosus TaxID=137266 RepID=A0AAE4C7W4_9ACTN|nr:phthalyl amidase [Catenuloplanes atrovinosus]MDR7274002.1 dienelactone hydrolase [Catenuloplanes atrovinosus]
MAAGSVALAALLAVTMLPAAPAAPPVVCDAPTPSATRPGLLIADPDCDPDGTPFTPIRGSAVHTGIEQGAAYRIEVPRRWNGRLVIFAHGYRGDGRLLFVSNPRLREHYLDRGYAWAASSYQLNGYEVGQGVRDSHALVPLFRRVTGTAARSVLMTGESMGGHVTAVAIEEFPRTFDGAMPVCGVLGDVALFDYFLDANVTAAALAGVPIGFPDAPSDAFDREWRAQVTEISARLGLNAGAPPSLTPAGRAWSDVVERRTGGDRAGFDASFAYWNTATSLEPFADLPFLFGLYPGLSGRADNVAGNRHTVYRITDAPHPTPAERRLNADVLRVSPTLPADPGLGSIPRVDGRPRVPVLSLHTTGDLFVPFSMEQIYARRAATPLFVSRAIRAPGHCDFTLDELRTAFDDLTRWTYTGHRAPGDPILDRRAVAAPTFGCRFTTETRPGFPACP